MARLVWPAQLAAQCLGIFLSLVAAVSWWQSASIKGFSSELQQLGSALVDQSAKTGEATICATFAAGFQAMVVVVALVEASWTGRPRRSWQPNESAWVARSKRQDKEAPRRKGHSAGPRRRLGQWIATLRRRQNGTPSKRPGSTRLKRLVAATGLDLKEPPQSA